MCCRFYLDDISYEAAVNQLHPAGTESITIHNRDIYPSETAPVILADSGREGLAVQSLIWGFPSTKEKGLLINARMETVLDKPMFSHGIRQNRCVIPAKCFYEWDENKYKASFFSQDNEVLYMAGLFDWVRGSDINYNRFVILTREADDVVRPVHNRMPLLIRGQDVPSWINDMERAEELLHSTSVMLYCEKDYEQLKIEL